MAERSTDEAYRPSFHFTPRRHWMNDPNGLIWYDGEYHLFFQHNPSGNDWGNLSWGHAVSRDLLDWEELSPALTATADEHVYSGSVVLDREDTSGLGSPGSPALVAVYTSMDPVTGRQAQSLASSVDRGRTWRRYPGNPVLDIGSHEFRDPKVSWDAERGCWVMVTVLAEQATVRIHRSPDLLSWEHLSDFTAAVVPGALWECPDLFALPVDGDPARVRWVLVVSVNPGAVAGGSGTLYFVGDFDGTTFRATGWDWLDHGADLYAAVSWNDTPDQERVLLGWMSNWDYAHAVPSSPFRGSMSLPRRCDLRSIDGAVRLVQAPVRAMQALVGSRTRVVLDGVRLGPGTTRVATGLDEAVALEVELRPGAASRSGLVLDHGRGGRTEIGYERDPEGRGWVYVDRGDSGAPTFSDRFTARHRAPLPLREGALRLQVFLDRASVEVFAGDGERVLTDLVFPTWPIDLAVFAEGDAVLVRLGLARLGRDSG